MKIKILLGLLTGSLLLVSCTWVKLTEDASNVTLLTDQEFALRSENCSKVGSTEVAVVDKVLLNRSARKVEEELTTLARNQAASRGNILVATSEVNNGEQAFDIYQCSK